MMKSRLACHIVNRVARRVWSPMFVIGALATLAVADVITGTDVGFPSTVKAFDASSSTTASFLAYTPSFAGGVRVAAGDINADGARDIITAAGPAGGGHVKVFDGSSGAEIRSFFAYGPSFTGGVFVGGGDVNNDAVDDVITGVDDGFAPHVKVFSGAGGAELRSFFAYSTGFTGGVRVAAGDVNGDTFIDVITSPGAAGNGHIKVFDGNSGAEIRSFFAYGPSFTGGVFVGGGDVNNDGFGDVITGADSGVASHVKVFSGATGAELRSFFAYPPAFTGGVRVAAGDVNGDGFADIITGAGAGGAGHVKVFSGATGAELQSFLAYGSGYSGGVFVAGSSVVPEPSSAALLLASGMSLATRRRRRLA
ncbi:MAG: VCBS repeat-containing protein [Pirellulales bacterium]|nr:VCBS repeat-containing protein [Pirellulales bacterium]